MRENGISDAGEGWGRLDRSAPQRTGRDKMRANEKISESALALTLLLLFLAADESAAKPIIRTKRVSDQRLAELETLLAISKMKEKLVTVPIGFGRVDPHKIGRRRRNTEEVFAEEQEEIHQTTEPITINR